MIFGVDEIKNVEKVLLGNYHFNESQKQFINLFNSSMVIAGPGTGKTTTLAAKIALMLQKIENNRSEKAICIITHTNVAVNEIKQALDKMGIKIRHPHFVGTIHSFFNRFCVEPYLRNKWHVSEVNFLDGPEYRRVKEEHGLYLLRRKYNWMNEKAFQSIVIRFNQSKLYIDYRGNIAVKEQKDWEKLPKYAKPFKEVLISIAKKGILSTDDTFFFARLFARCDSWKALLNKRFDYLFVDEYQDTSIEGIDLLMDIFSKNNTIIQFIGDSMQKIYSDTNGDIPLENNYTLNTTNRFGDKIMTMLSNIFNVESLNTLESKANWKPILLVYDNPDEIIPTYKKLIKLAETKNKDFKLSTYGDKILVRYKKLTKKIIDNGVYVEKKKQNNESRAQLASEFIIRLLLERTLLNGKKLKSKDIRKEFGQDINKVCLGYIWGKKDDRKYFFKNSVTQLLDKVGGKRIKEKDLENIEAEFKNIFFKDNQAHPVSEEVNDIYTIHSVKGETHRSSLVINIDDKNNSDISFTSILRQAYLAEKINDHVGREKNLLYVALSRAKYLVVLTVSQREFSDDLKKGVENDWKVVYANTVLRSK